MDIPCPAAGQPTGMHIQPSGPYETSMPGGHDGLGLAVGVGVGDGAGVDVGAGDGVGVGGRRRRGCRRGRRDRLRRRLDDHRERGLRRAGLALGDDDVGLRPLLRGSSGEHTGRLVERHAGGSAPEQRVGHGARRGEPDGLHGGRRQEAPGDSRRPLLARQEIARRVRRWAGSDHHRQRRLRLSGLAAGRHDVCLRPLLRGDTREHAGRRAEAHAGRRSFRQRVGHGVLETARCPWSGRGKGADTAVEVLLRGRQRANRR